MRTMLLATAALWLAGCVHQQNTSAALERQTPFGLIQVGAGYSYLIDPRTESCFLREFGGGYNFVLVAVPCAKLKKNVPEAADYITWEPEVAPTAPSTGTPPTK